MGISKKGEQGQVYGCTIWGQSAGRAKVTCHLNGRKWCLQKRDLCRQLIFGFCATVCCLRNSKQNPGMGEFHWCEALWLGAPLITLLSTWIESESELSTSVQ